MLICHSFVLLLSADLSRRRAEGTVRQAKKCLPDSTLRPCPALNLNASDGTRDKRSARRLSGFCGCFVLSSSLIVLVAGGRRATAARTEKCPRSRSLQPYPALNINKREQSRVEREGGTCLQVRYYSKYMRYLTN